MLQDEVLGLLSVWLLLGHGNTEILQDLEVPLPCDTYTLGNELPVDHTLMVKKGHLHDLLAVLIQMWL